MIKLSAFVMPYLTCKVALV